MNYSLDELNKAYASGELTPLDHIQRVIRDIGRAGPEGRYVFTETFFDQAVAMARSSTQRWASGQNLGPFDGVPVVWKDVFDIAGTVTTCGSRVRQSAAPARQDAALVGQLTAAGALGLGKTTLSEFAYSGLGINPFPGTPRNPASPQVARIPGGSSSGSAVAVSLGWTPCGIGTDTSGSIRIPAAFQGLVGFKPSHGRYATGGMFPLAPSLDTAGPIVRTARDAWLFDQAFGGASAGCSAGPLNNWCFVVPEDSGLGKNTDGVQQAFDAFVGRLKDYGATVVYRRFEAFALTQQLFENEGTLVAVEASRVHRALFESDDFAKVDPRIAARMRLGFELPESSARQIEQRRPEWVALATAQLASNEVLLYPTVTMTAPEIAPLEENPDWFAQCNRAVLRNTMLASYLDMPTLNLPAGVAPDNGLPVGVSLSLAQGADATLLQLGIAVQEAV